MQGDGSARPRSTNRSFFTGLCVTVFLAAIICSGHIDDWTWLWGLPWPVRVAAHIALLFFVPSAVLGTAGPVVAKMALAQPGHAGSTDGRLYAWGTAGSIFGTFAAGYVLIAALGPVVKQNIQFARAQQREQCARETAARALQACGTTDWSKASADSRRCCSRRKRS